MVARRAHAKIDRVCRRDVPTTLGASYGIALEILDSRLTVR